MGKVNSQDPIAGERLRASGRPMDLRIYVCPDCKVQLESLKCRSCGEEFTWIEGFPILLSREPRFSSARQIAATYDEIYANRSAVWEDQGRTPEFIAFFSDLLAGISAGKILEIGCGEGFLISNVRAKETYAIDLSTQALRKAWERASAQFCVAIVERLPFPGNSFDTVMSVGVMEHFLDDREATKEIYRVLRPGGHYVALIHVEMSKWQTFAQKLREYVFPRLRPFELAKWMVRKVKNPIRQPILRRYSRQSAQACLEACGFSVDQTISKTTHPNVPLIGPHVIIYVARKPS